MRRCPRCGRALTRLGVGEVQLDGCDGCGGVWFDRQEMQAVAGADPAQLHSLEEHFQPDPDTTRRREHAACPVCDCEMVEFSFKHSPGIVLDGCPQCKGIWADEGELEAIYARTRGAAAEARETTAPQPQKAHEAVGFLVRAACPECGQPNPAGSSTCWACGKVLQRSWGLLCPQCVVPLAGRATDLVDLDACCTCGGVWLASPTLAKLADQRVTAWTQLEEAAGLGSFATVTPRSPRPCPTCRVPLVDQTFAYGASVRIDRCGTCLGVWLDHGELRRIGEFFDRDQQFYIR